MKEEKRKELEDKIMEHIILHGSKIAYACNEMKRISLYLIIDDLSFSEYKALLDKFNYKNSHIFHKMMDPDENITSINLINLCADWFAYELQNKIEDLFEKIKKDRQ